MTREPAVARVFLGLGLGAERGERVMAAVIEALGGPETAVAGFRLPRPEGLHLTLAFLGDQPRTRLDELWREASSRLVGAPSPSLRMTVPGAFPRRGQERVLWLGVEEPGGEGHLAQLLRGVLGAVRAYGAGFDERRAFRPHVTVARPRGRRSLVPDRFYSLDLDPETRDWPGAELALFESVASRRGPRRYEELRRLAREGPGLESPGPGLP